MKTTIIAVTGSGPSGMQSLAELELPAVPLPGEHVHFNGRTFRALERSWRLTSAAEEVDCAVGLLVEQIAGPPLVLLHSGGMEAN